VARTNNSTGRCASPKNRLSARLNPDLRLGQVQGCLVAVCKILDVTGDVRRGVGILIKKTNYITHLKTVRRIY
jgi:hypothetical protein